MRNFFIIAFCFLLIAPVAIAQDYGSGASDWMSKDLDVKVFRNGDTLFYAKTAEQWQRAADSLIPAYCYVNGDSKKGVLYNWTAVDDPRGLAPYGYRLPGVEDFEKIKNDPLRTTNGNWKSLVTQKSNFNAFAWGYRSFEAGDYYSEGDAAYYWTMDKGVTLKSKCMVLLDDGLILQENRREDGLSIRCKRNYDETIPPQRLTISKRLIRPGELVTIEATGGILGADAKLLWFENVCGTTSESSIDQGRKVSFSPRKTTTYFLQSTYNGSSFECLSVEVIVDDGTILPNSIVGNNTACAGETIELSIVGGELGTGAQWVWYENYVDGAVSIGRGATLRHVPAKTTTYYLRSEANGEKYTEFIKKVVDVIQTQVKPIIEITSNNLCSGETATLSAKGQLNSGYSWVWEVANKKVGQGPTYSQRLNESTSFTLYAQSATCGRTETVTQTIKVSKPTVLPTSITETKLSFNKSTFTLNGQSLGSNAEWVWYTYRKNGQIRKIGTGSQLDYRVKTTTELVVKPQNGRCDNISLSGTKYIAYRSSEVLGWNQDYDRTSKILHLGFELGLSSNYNPDYLLLDTSNYWIPSYGYGLRLGTHFHPIINEYFTLGVRASWNYNILKMTQQNALYDYWNRQDASYDQYTYTQNYGAEFALGIAKRGVIKLLADYNIQYDQSYVLVTDPNSLTTYGINYSTRIESFGAGFRFGSYEGKDDVISSEKKEYRGKHVDLLYTLSRISTNRPFDLSRNQNGFDYNNMSQWLAGFQMRIWLHASSRFNIGFVLPVNSYNLDMNIDFSKAYFTFGWMLSFDFFR